MKVCKVSPLKSDCRMCVDTWETFGGGDVSLIPECSTCHYNTDKYEILDFVNGLFGTCALLQRNGVIKKVDISRLRDVKEVGGIDG